jgi:hypothetical protein
MPSTPAEKSNAETDSDARSKLRFPSWYNPYSPEGVERRRKLFENIARDRTAGSEEAMDQLIAMFEEDDDPQ